MNVARWLHRRCRMARGALPVVLALLTLTSPGGALGSGTTDSLEPNNDPGQAYAVVAGVEVESWISTGIDVDWYVFSTEEAGTITILLRSLPADYDVALYWLNPGTGELEQPENWISEKSGTQDEAIQVAAELAGSFFVQVYGVSGANDPDDSYSLTAIFPVSESGQPPAVTVLSPNGNEWLTVGTTPTISYFATDPETPAGNLAIALDYSTNGGATWIAIANSIQNTGSYVWTVPATPTMNGRIRVTAGDGVLEGSDASNTAFTIAQPPQGPNTLAMGKGTAESGSLVAIPLTLANADAVRQIETYVAFDPALVTYLRGEVTGRAPGMTYFASLVGGNTVHVNLSYPEGERLLAGGGAIANLTFSLIGPGETESDLIPQSSILQDPNGQHLSVTEEAGLIRLTQPLTQAPVVTVSSPNGSEVLIIGSQTTILYVATDPDTPAEGLLNDLDYSTNGGSTWTTIATMQPNNGWYSWTVSDIATTRGRIRVTSTDGTKVGFDVSNANFTIAPPAQHLNAVALGSGSGTERSEVTVPLTLANADAVKSLTTEIVFDPAVVSYSGGSSTGRGSGMNFTATVVGGDRIRVVLSHAGAATLPLGSGTIAEIRLLLIGQGGTQTALTPTATILSDPEGHLLDVTTEAGSVTVTTTATQPPVVTVVTPNGGETLTAGATTSITYVATDLDTPQAELTIDLDYSMDGGATWTPIASSQPNIMSYAWTSPIQTSSQGRIRVTASDGENHRSDTSNGDFTIAPPPQRENRMALGSGTGRSGDDVIVPINLANGDRIRDLTTEILFDPAVAEYASGEATDRGFGMTYAASVIDENRVRVALTNPLEATLSEGAGTLAELRFHLVGPGGTQTALTPTVTILSDASGQPLDVTAEAGAITIATTPAQAPVVTVVFPNGSESLTAGTRTTVTYVATDPDTPQAELAIDLHYSTDSGATWTSIAVAQPNSMAYSWTVPDAVTSQGRIRVTASDGAKESQDISNADFTIIPTPLLQNRLAIGAGTGPSGGHATVPLALANEDLIRSLVTDIVFDSSIVAYVSGSTTARATGMVYAGQVMDGNRLHVSLFYPDATTLPAGSGALAEISFNLIGAGGTQTTLTPATTTLIGSNDQPVAVTMEAGRIDVTQPDLQAPRLRLSVLRNPGRPRSIQIFVTSDQQLDQLTVTAASSTVPTQLIDAIRNIHMGSLLVGSETRSVTIEATGVAAGRAGSARTSVTF